MMDLFVALFGGAFWGAKLCSDKIKSSSYDRLQAKVEAAYDKGYKEWKEKVIDRELEMSVRRRLNEDFEYRRKIEDEMYEEFGEMYISRFVNSSIPVSAYYVLAKQGKIPVGASTGIHIAGADQTHTSCMIRWEKEMFLVNWIYKQLIEHHGEDVSKLMFEPLFGRDRTVIPIESIKKYEPGKVIWSAASYSTYWDMFERHKD